MRTTLTIDDDVAAELERLRKQRDANLKDLVNEALRIGMREMVSPKKRRKPFKIEPLNLGPALFPIDNVEEALAFAEGEDHK